MALVVTSNLIVKVRATTRANDGIPDFVTNLLLDPWMWVAVVATAAGMFIYVLTIRKVDISYAQPILALVFVITPLAAWLLTGETISPLRATGLFVMALGIAIVAKTGF